MDDGDDVGEGDRELVDVKDDDGVVEAEAV
jgi:hypothetical protein